MNPIYILHIGLHNDVDYSNEEVLDSLGRRGNVSADTITYSPYANIFPSEVRGHA
jgi:hypothetical protein